MRGLCPVAHVVVRVGNGPSIPRRLLRQFAQRVVREGDGCRIRVVRDLCDAPIRIVLVAQVVRVPRGAVALERGMRHLLIRIIVEILGLSSRTVRRLDDIAVVIVLEVLQAAIGDTAQIARDIPCIPQ